MKAVGASPVDETMTIRESKKVFEDEQLVRSCADGDEAALKELYFRYNHAIFNYLYRMLPDRTAAEDLLEETFFRVWRKASLFDERKGSFKTWLFRMASRLAINRLKKRARRERLAAHISLGDQEVEDTSMSPEKEVDTLEVRSLVLRALETLSEKDRAVLVLRHLKGLGEEEVAQALGIPKGTVKSRTYYAVRRLKGALEGMGV